MRTTELVDRFRTLLAVAAFEIRFSIARRVTPLCALMLFGLGLLVTYLSGHIDDHGYFLPIGAGRSLTVHTNAPHAIAIFHCVLAPLSALIALLIAGDAGSRDHRSGTHPLIATTPLSPLMRAAGQITGLSIVGGGLLLLLTIGLASGALLPGMSPSRFGPSIPSAWLPPVLFISLPNVVITSVIFYALARLNRSARLSYIAAICLTVLPQLLGQSARGGVSSWADPFGCVMVGQRLIALSEPDKNSIVLWPDPALVAHRLLWLALSIGLLIAILTRSQRASTRPAPSAPEPQRVTTPASLDTTASAPHPQPVVGPMVGWAQWSSTTRRCLAEIFRDRVFALVLMIGGLVVMFSLETLGANWDASPQARTFVVLEVLAGDFATYLKLVVLFYAGELVWRARELGVAPLEDSTPTSMRVRFLAQATALSIATGALLCVSGLVGMAVQLVKAQAPIELDVYAAIIFGVHLPELVLLGVLGLAIHAIAASKPVGSLLTVLYLVGSAFRNELGLEHPLLWLGALPEVRWSDLSGFGEGLISRWAFVIVWGCATLAIATLAAQMAPRGIDPGLRRRWTQANATPWTRRATGALGGLTVLGIGVLFWLTVVANGWQSDEVQRIANAEYERRYGRWIDQPTLAVVETRAEIELWPGAGALDISAVLTLQNLTSAPIDEVLLTLPEHGVNPLVEVPEGWSLTDEDGTHRVYRLAQPIPPDKMVSIAFEARIKPGGLPAVPMLDQQHRRIHANGTFLYNLHLLPTLGFDTDRLLRNPESRRSHQLPPDVTEPRPSTDRSVNCSQGSRTDLDVVITTEADQIAVAPGVLIEQSIEGERARFHYRSDLPVVPCWPIVSGRYTRSRGQWGDVELLVLHHPAHSDAVPEISRALRDTLTLGSRVLGPYPHKTLTVVEFPRGFGGFGQAFPGIILMSEARFLFSAAPGQLGTTYLMTAHEAAHQWWGHGVTAADMPGSPLVTESLAEYTATLVAAHSFGPATVEASFDRQQASYFAERHGEPSLMTVDYSGSSRIYYTKGMLVLYALQDLMGLDAMERTLGEFYRKHSNGPPYATAADLHAVLRHSLPDDVAYSLEDGLDRITTHANRVVSATSTRMTNGWTRVEITIAARKSWRGEDGVDTEQEMDDLIDIGLHLEDRSTVPLYLEKHRLQAGEQQVVAVSKSPPAWVSIDPRALLLDGDRKDNWLKLP